MRSPALITLLVTLLSITGRTHGWGNDGYNEPKHKQQKAVAVDCTTNFCKTQLSSDLEKRWHVIVPTDYDSSDDACAECKITVQLIYDGYTWLGYGVSPDGSMVGSTVVIGSPSDSEKELPTVYELKDKVPMREWFTGGFNLENASIKYDTENAQTIMEFTAPFNAFNVTEEDAEYRVGISLNSPTNFIYAHGSEGKIEPQYHGVNNKGSRTLENLINPEAASLADDGKASDASAKNVWMAHSILAFLAWLYILQ